MHSHVTTLGVNNEVSRTTCIIHSKVSLVLINCAVFPREPDHRATPLTEDMHLRYIAVAVRCEQPTAGYNMQHNKQGTYVKLQQLAKNTKEASTLENVDKWMFFAIGLKLFKQ